MNKISDRLGIALDKGYFDGVERKALDFYPEYTTRRGEKTIPLITIRDMLAMTVPYNYQSFTSARPETWSLRSPLAFNPE